MESTQANCPNCHNALEYWDKSSTGESLFFCDNPGSVCYSSQWATLYRLVEHVEFWHHNSDSVHYEPIPVGYADEDGVAHEIDFLKEVTKHL